MPKFKWTDKRELFCVKYIACDLNATKAAIEAGYAAGSACKEACRLMGFPAIQDRIAELKAERVERAKIDADYVLHRLVDIDQMDCADILNDEGGIKPIQKWPKVWRTYISGFEITELIEGRGDEREMVGILKKIKWPDKLKNLELLGKHIGVQAFKEKLDVEVGAKKSLQELLREAAQDE